MLNMNKYMFTFLFASYELLGSTLTTALSFLSNNILNVINFFYFRLSLEYFYIKKKLLIIKLLAFY
jgi:hypothetical protein